jgi:hypothetical protein
MSLQLSDIERRLQILIEVHLVKFLPRPVTQDQIAQLIAEAMMANLATQSLTQMETSVPSEFILAVHPSRLEQWSAEPRLMEGLTKIIRLVASEMSLQLSTAPTMLLAADPLLAVDALDVRINKTDIVAETQNMPTSGEEIPARAAFLIVGGTNVYTIDRSVTNIGRRMDNQLVVDDPRVSRYHAQIRYVRSHFVIFDLNSTGGTFVNGQRTTQSVLYPGDVISLAGLPIVFGQDTVPPSVTRIGDTAPLSPASSDRATISLDHPEPSDDELK